MFKTMSVFALLFVGFLSVAEARVVIVTGNGSERSFCNANSGNFCLDRIKRQSEQNAAYSAQRQCEINRGRALTYTATYSTNCSPNYLPPRHDSTYVSCYSRSSMQCEIRD